MFSIGDYVIKVNTGVCVVDAICEMDLLKNGEPRTYYTLIPLHNSKSRVYVPVDSDKLNMRSILSEDEAWVLIRQIPDIEEAWIPNDKLREQEYKDAIRSNDPRRLVSIIKNMYLRGKERVEQGKKITAIDERYFKMSEETLYSELAAAIGRDVSEIADLIARNIGGPEGE